MATDLAEPVFAELEVRRPWWPIVAAALVVFWLGFIGWTLARWDPVVFQTVPPTTTTSVDPFCVGVSRVIPGTGVVDVDPGCPSPAPQHAEPGTGPTTGPNGEPR